MFQAGGVRAAASSTIGRNPGGTIAIAFTNENELQRLYEYLTEKK